jgi:hypothetical protein
MRHGGQGAVEGSRGGLVRGLVSSNGYLHGYGCHPLKLRQPIRLRVLGGLFGRISRRIALRSVDPIGDRRGNQFRHGHPLAVRKGRRAIPHGYRKVSNTPLFTRRITIRRGIRFVFRHALSPSALPAEHSGFAIRSIATLIGCGGYMSADPASFIAISR